MRHACTLGDLRSNENVPLTIHQTVWFRLHNVIVKDLQNTKVRGRKLNNTQIHEEARRVNIAIYQHVVYNEFLPLLVGKTTQYCLDQ